MRTLIELSEYTTNVQQVEDGDEVTQENLDLAPQALANRTKYLKNTKAPIESPAFTGAPTAPTQATGNNSTRISTTAFVEAKNGAATPLPAAESAVVGSSNKLAREDHVHPSNLSSSASDIKMNGAQSAGASTKPARADHVHPTDTTRAPLNSPTFTGEPKAPTPAAGDSSTKVSTTEFVINNGAPAGTVIFSARPTPPTGYLKANGAQVSRTTYAALFAAIGTTFGSGDGYTTFAIPDLRGEFVRGWDDGRGTDSGRSLGSAQLDAMQRLTGSFSMDDRGTVDPATGVFTYGPLTNTGSEGSGFGYRVNFDNANQARTAEETRPRNVALLACIKY